MNIKTITIASVIYLAGFNSMILSARVISVGHVDFNAENSLDRPETVVPKESQVNVSEAEFEVCFGPNSVTIVRLAAQD